MLIDRRDIDFLCEWLGLDELLCREKFQGQTSEEVHAILSLTEQLAENELAPHLRRADDNEPQLSADGDVILLPEVAAAVGQMAEAGLFGAVFDTDLGGFQLPNLVHTAALGILMSANISTASFVLLTVGNARLLARYGSPAQVKAFAMPQIAGQAMGTMCLSESQAGSSLGDITTRALPDGEGPLGARYRLKGDKMWISAGDHGATKNIVHLVLAKIASPGGEAPSGTAGISLFVVPKYLEDGQRNDIAVAGLNHKLGYRGIPNCALSFGGGRFAPDGEAGAIGWLVGEPGQGLAQMFQMMNDARVSVGLGGAMLACRGYQMSLEYARDRLQGRTGGQRGGPQAPIIQHPDVRRMLLAQKAYSQGALALVLFSAKLLDDEHTAPTQAERDQAGSLLALLTPATKTWPSEWAQTSLHHGLQIHGGAGYTRDFEIELLGRDNRINPIHEGTTGIQGLDFVNRKIKRDQGQTFAQLAERIRSDIATAKGVPQLLPFAARLEDALKSVERAVEAVLDQGDSEILAAHATSLLFAFGHLVVGWLWISQTEAAAHLSSAHASRRSHLEGRTKAARFFADHELPKIDAWLQPFFANSNVVLEIADDEF